jgi:hypothetical protein
MRAAATLPLWITESVIASGPDLASYAEARRQSAASSAWSA